MEIGQKTKVCGVEHIVAQCTLCHNKFWKQTGLKNKKKECKGVCGTCYDGSVESNRAVFPMDRKGTRPENN